MDSFIFDDDYEEAGGETEAFCPKCKADTTHTIITKYEDEIRRVQCGVCGDVHSFRKPRGETEDEAPEPIAAKRRASAKKYTFEEFFRKYDARKARDYSPRESYDEQAIINHPKFGVGFVSEVIVETSNVPGKIEVTFRDERRLLVHRWEAGPQTLPSGPPGQKGKNKIKWEAPPPPPPPPGKRGAEPKGAVPPAQAAGAAAAKGKKGGKKALNGAVMPATPPGKAAIAPAGAPKAAGKPASAPAAAPAKPAAKATPSKVTPSKVTPSKVTPSKNAPAAKATPSKNVAPKAPVKAAKPAKPAKKPAKPSAKAAAKPAVSVSKKPKPAVSVSKKPKPAAAKKPEKKSKKK